jgi:hypothetical protein
VRDGVLGHLDQSLCDRRGSRLWGGGCKMRPSGWEAYHRHRVVWRVWGLPEYKRILLEPREDGSVMRKMMFAYI